MSDQITTKKRLCYSKCNTPTTHTLIENGLVCDVCKNSNYSTPKEQKEKQKIWVVSINIRTTDDTHNNVVLFAKEKDALAHFEVEKKDAFSTHDEEELQDIKDYEYSNWDEGTHYLDSYDDRYMRSVEIYVFQEEVR